jgi:hypothetical protein
MYDWGHVIDVIDVLGDKGKRMAFLLSRICLAVRYCKQEAILLLSLIS